MNTVLLGYTVHVKPQPPATQPGRQLHQRLLLAVGEVHSMRCSRVRRLRTVHSPCPPSESASSDLGSRHCWLVQIQMRQKYPKKMQTTIARKCEYLRYELFVVVWLSGQVPDAHRTVLSTNHVHRLNKTPPNNKKQHISKQRNKEQ